MRNGFHTLLHTQTPPPPLLGVPRRRQQWPPSFSVKPTPNFSRRISTKARRWDSNAETFRTQNFDFRSVDDEDGGDDFDDDDATQWLDVLEDFIDGVWIFKVFRSYGWILPAIISSLLLTSGPKAFLMALALPLGQSALSFAFQTVWARSGSRTKRKRKRKPPSPPRPPPRPPPCNADSGGEGEREAAMGYQTWVVGGDEKGGGGGGGASGFGGWEELDRGGKSGGRSKGARKTATAAGKLSGRGRRGGGTPLLLRLLIAVFPFLGTWTRMM